MKRIRKSICRLLVICMLVTMLPMSVFAESSEIARGTCGDNLTWVLRQDGVLTISGEGTMKNYSSGGAPWYVYRNDILQVVIEDGVTSIGKNAFYSDIYTYNSSYNSLTSVEIPDSVTSIGTYAFGHCTELCSVNIGNGVISINSHAFYDCDSLISITIPEGVTSIGDYAFTDCDSLSTVVIPSSVTRMGSFPFDMCGNLLGIWVDEANTQFSSDSNGVLFNKDKTVLIGAPGGLDGDYTIPEGVTKVNAYAFDYCYNLINVIIPESVTNLGNYAFLECTSLKGIWIDAGNEFYSSDSDGVLFSKDKTKLIHAPAELHDMYTIPDSVTSISSSAFSDSKYKSLKSIIFAGNAPTIGSSAFYLLTITAYYPVDNDTWTEDVMQNYGGNITWVAYDSQESTPSDSDLEITGLSINKIHDKFYAFMGDSTVYNMDSPNAVLYLELNQIAVVDNDVISPADIVWTSSDETVLRIISSGTEEDMYVNLRVEGLVEGTAALTATNPAGETLSFEVTVVKPNALAFTNVYDTKQYYSSGAFYSTASSISDSVEIFVQFENALIEGYPCKVEDELVGNISNIAPITLTATVSGSDLSFDRNNYQNTYTACYDAVTFGNSFYDTLTLFPIDISNFDVEYGGRSYTVEVTLQSASFNAPIVEVYTFTIYDIETERVGEHLDFINDNPYYNVSKQNIYGESMLSLKDDGEYQWSKWSTLDFENYYEVVWADTLIGVLDVAQTDISIIPTVLKEWHGTYKTLLSGISTIVEDTYSDITKAETRIDKLLKASKYESDATCADEEIYQVVVDMFGNNENIDIIQSAFEAVDKTKQVFGFVKFTGDVVDDFVSWANTVNVLNAFSETDESFKQVFQMIANNIPDSEGKMKDAVEDYLNYSYDHSGYVEEMHETLLNLGKDITIDVYKGIIGQTFQDWCIRKVLKWIGTKPFHTAEGWVLSFSTTTQYATLTSAIGGVATGVSLGLCISDLLCNSEDKAAEMGKIIAMSEYAPFIIQALEYYEDNLRTSANNDAVILFERAFDLHQASQSYIMEHTVKALEAKAGSILQFILGNDDYEVLIADILVQKDTLDSIECCEKLDGETRVNTKKVIAIKCPVNVYIYDENDAELVRIVNDTVEYVADGLKVFVQDGEKYVAMPASQVYSIKIVATDEGTMTYAVLEYNEGAQLYRTLRRTSIPLEDERIFTGVVVEPLGVEPESYALTYDNGTIVPHDVTTCNHIYANACDTTCNDCGAVRTTIHTWKTTLSYNATQHWTECSVCGEKKDVEGHIGGSADCQNKAVCTDCQQPYGELTGCDVTAEKAEDKYLKSAATCKDVAVYCKSCAVCGKAGTETFTHGTIDKTNHTGETEVRGAAIESCTVDGYTGDTYCKGCGVKTITGQTIPATAHKAATTVAEVASTCKTNGVKAHFHCPACDKDFLEKTVAAVAQTADDLKLPLNAEKHEGGTEVRDAIPMTCTDDGYTGDTYCKGCTVKIATGTAIPAEHKLDKVTANPATHDAAGNIEHYACSVCEKLFNDDKATTELTEAEVVIPKGEHSYSETFKSDENGHWKECECGSKIVEGAHAYGEWVTTKKADVGVEGSKERTCSVCGYKQTEKLPATTTPATGDNTHIGFLFILMLISACGMITMQFVVPRKKGKYQH